MALDDELVILIVLPDSIQVAVCDFLESSSETNILLLAPSPMIWTSYDRQTKELVLVLNSH